MASTYTTNLQIEKVTTGEKAGLWGTVTNTNLEILEQALGGYLAKSIAGSAQTTTLAITDGDSTASTSEARHQVIKLTGTITGNQVVTVPNDVVKSYIVSNATSGAYTVVFQTVSGSGFTFATTNKGVKLLFADGTNVVDTGISSVGTYDLDGGELTLDADSDTSITASTDDQIDFEIAGADDFTMTANAFNVLTGSHATFADSANAKFGTGNDMLVYHDGSNSYITNATGALKIATETSGIALTIGHTTSETTIADNLTVTGTLTGTLATAAQGSVTSLGTLTTLTVDNIITNGTTIGHTDDTDLITLADGAVTVAGTIGSGAITSTGIVTGTAFTAGSAVLAEAELELLDGLTAGTAIASKVVTTDSSIDTTGQRNLTISGELDAATLDISSSIDIAGASQFSGAITVGVDDTGLDVKFFGAAAGAYGLYDQSENAFEVRGATAAGAGLLKLTTGELTVVDADKLGRIDFQSPLESDGTDSVAIAASIWAEADDTFSTSVNNTDLVFALGKSEAAAEKFRFTADTEIGIAGANYGSDGQVLTSGGAGAAVAWEAIPGASALAADDLTAGDAAVTLSTSSGNITVDATANNSDIIFKGTDATSDITMLTLDGSEAGAATFNDKVIATELDISGNMDIDGTANLDIVDIDGAVDMASTLAVAGVSSFAVAANVAQVAITSSSNAVAWDASAAANAYHLTTENTTLSAPSNAVEGAFICLEINFDGSHTFSWNAIFNFAADTAPTTTDTDAKTDIFVFRYNGAIWQEVGRTLNIPES